MADLTVQAILTAQTSGFQRDIQRAGKTAQTFSRDVRKVQSDVNNGKFNGGFFAEFNKQLQSRSYKEVFNRGLGSLGLLSGMAGDLIGNKNPFSRGIGALGDITGQAAMGSLAGGPLGALIFGGAAATKQILMLSKSLKELEINAAAAQAAMTKQLLDRRRQVQDDVRALRQAVVPEKALTPQQIRGEILQRMEAQRQLVNTAKINFGPGGRVALKQQYDAMQTELRRLDANLFFQGFTRSMGKFGRGVFDDIAETFQQAVGMVPTQKIAFTARTAFGAFLANSQKMQAADAEVFARVMQLSEHEAMSPPLAVRGTNEYLKQITAGDKKNGENISDLVKIAKEQLAEEKRQADEIAKEIAKQRVTVRF